MKILDELLARYLCSDATIDYERWHSNDGDRAAWLTAVDELASQPPSDASHEQALAYWLNLYNGLVIAEILRRWPIASVRDVRAGLLRGSKGFFRGLRFRVGRDELTLDDIEHTIIREQYRDARIHFALNCGARSCPRLDILAFTPAAVDEQLTRAAREFFADRRNLEVDHGKKVVTLSKLLKWYAGDFLEYARKSGRVAAPTILDFIAMVADPMVAAEVEKARGYRVRYRPYDWSVNVGKSV